MFRKLFDFYIRASLHVALSVWSLTAATYYMFEMEFNTYVLGFVFTATVVGYNYTKYNIEVLRNFKQQIYKGILILSLLCILASLWFFVHLDSNSHYLIFITSLFTVLYVVPFYRDKNLRRLEGIKIYIVAFCWVLLTLLLPLVEAGYTPDTDVLVKSIQRFLLIIVLILIFEIIDLKEDTPELKTVPQAIGVARTKIFGTVLLLLFFFLELLFSHLKTSQLYINTFMGLLAFLFTCFASEKKSKYYTTFWVEGIPILWFVLIALFR